MDTTHPDMIVESPGACPRCESTSVRVDCNGFTHPNGMHVIGETFYSCMLCGYIAGGSPPSAALANWRRCANAKP